MVETHELGLINTINNLIYRNIVSCIEKIIISDIVYYVNVKIMNKNINLIFLFLTILFIKNNFNMSKIKNIKY